MVYKILKSYAKINVHLGVLKKLKNKFHKIETVVVFADLHDQISIKETKKKNHEVIFYGKYSNGIKKNNTVTKLFKILDKKNILDNRKYIVKIKKNIPQQSGMGGGSMNASTLLKYLIKSRTNISKNKIYQICSEIGSDVILGMQRGILILKDNGSLIKKKLREKYYLIIIKPNFGCKTSDIYRNVQNYSKTIIQLNKSEIKLNSKKFNNDLEKVAFKKYSKLKEIKKDLLDLPNIEFARMSGSGSSMIGYFTSKIDANHGAKLLKNKYKFYWCITSKTI